MPARLTAVGFFRNQSKLSTSTDSVHLTAFGEHATPQKQLNEPWRNLIICLFWILPNQLHLTMITQWGGGQMHLKAD